MTDSRDDEIERDELQAELEQWRMGSAKALELVERMADEEELSIVTRNRFLAGA